MTSLPAPADGAMAERGLERWLALDHSPELQEFARNLAEDPWGRRLLAALFGNSPFLTQCCLHEARFLGQLLAQGPDAAFARLIGSLRRRCSITTAARPGDRAGLVSALRIAKRRAALLIALADIVGLWPLERVTETLSAFADAALSLAVRHLLAAAAAAGDIVPPNPVDVAAGSGFIILGMGKLGGRELNYSSDIDLIVLFDADKVNYTGTASVQQCFARIARELVRLLDERTAEGYVFRTDLRLRPDPASTPPALSLEAAITYYESAGQNWERAALIKARPVAGDIAAGEDFLRELRPFLWRRHLDFAAIEDIHSIKRQINAHRGGSRIAIHGHNIKLGRGGIREIEFFAQTQQLIWGGRMPELRVAATVTALHALAATGRIDSLVADEMSASYAFHRRVEHRLQMIDDAQTHSLPADDLGIARLATFLGYAETASFVGDLRFHLGQVEKHYARLFEEAPSLAGPGNLVFTGTEDDPETLATIRRLGFAEPATVAAAIRGWHHGRYRAMRSQRAREILTELVPALLRALGATANPDSAFIRLDQFLGRLPAGVQLFSLLEANPGLLDLLAEIMGGAPRLAEQLAQHPIRLDSVLSADFFAPLPDRNALAADYARTLAGARDYSDVLDLARRWANDRKFQIGVHLLRHRIDGDRAGEAFADVAETVIAGLVPAVATEFARAHGAVPGGRFAVFGLGKLGGREMTVTSDLDLILFYDAPASTEASDGPRPLAVSTYFARLSQRLINALTALTPEGLLYEVDMRLRPSGNAGPIASSLAAFRLYHEGLAWTWEHMALTRARAVAGDRGLGAEAMALIRAVLTRPRDRDRLLVDVAEMRARIAAQHGAPPFWEVKHRRGGLVDAEFIAQYLMLRHAERHPELIAANTSTALDGLATAGLVERGVADDILAALRLWRQVQGMLKLLLDGPLEEAAPPALKALLARGAGAIDFAALKADMTAAATRVLQHFEGLIEAPAAAARSRVAAQPAAPPANQATTIQATTSRESSE